MSNSTSDTILEPQSRAPVTAPALGYPPFPVARKIYLKVIVGGLVALIIAIFCIFGIFWGALWKVPAGSLSGLIVNYDDGQIGDTVTQILGGMSDGKIAWRVASSQDYPGGAERLSDEVANHKVWIAVAINSGASQALQASVQNPNPSYNGSNAITVIATEARQENAFRGILRPIAQMELEIITKQFAVNFAKSVSSNPAFNATNILSISPQTIVEPVGYTLRNLRPFDFPVATGSTFVGLIFLLILTFFIVMISDGAREASGLQFTLSTPSLIILRLGTAFIGFFFVSLFYSLLNLAFQLPVHRFFGHGGFMIFWMLNWCAMLSTGLAIDSMFTLLGARFVPFFLLLWVIGNVSVVAQPIEVLPSIFRYAHAAPFYVISQGVRAIVFGTKNTLGKDFGILIAWIALSCITLTVFQILARRFGWHRKPEIPLEPDFEPVPEPSRQKELSREEEPSREKSQDH